MKMTMNNDLNFEFIGNDPALDLVNTKMMVQEKLTDLLQTDEGVVAWAKGVGLSVQLQSNENLLASTRKLRKALRGVFVALLDNETLPETALAVINRALTYYPPTQQLSVSTKGLHFGSIDEQLTPKEFLGAIAHSAAELLVSPQIKRLKRCDNHKCVLLFIDTSRANRRRWCSMKTCGNRAKAEGHYWRWRQ